MMRASSGPTAGSIADRSLDRHQERRAAGRPAASVLIGPAATGLACLQRWAETRARPLAAPLRGGEGTCPDVEAATHAWLAAMEKGRASIGAAESWLARRLGYPPGELALALRARGPIERDLFLDHALPSSSATGVEDACRWLLGPAYEGPLDADRLATDLDAALIAHPRPWARVLIALGALVEPARQPVLALVAPDRGRGAEGTRRLARLATELAIDQPALAPVLVVEAAVWDDFLVHEPDSRHKAILHEGAILLEREPISPPPPPSGPDRDPSLRRRIADRAEPDLPALFEEARETLRRAEAEPDDPSLRDRARSAAERFLFERLESLAATAGLFRLNATLEFPFGPGRPAEVDLLAASLKLAVEIDGYRHFQDPDAYRRDRRKDLSLQRHGYLIARVLAEDVVARLEDVLDTILAAVEFRRQTPA